MNKNNKSEFSEEVLRNFWGNEFYDKMNHPLYWVKYAKVLIEKDEDLLIKYPSLEDALKLIDKVIKMEEDI